jgi:hypothetical protein
LEEKPDLVKDVDFQRVNWNYVLRRASFNRVEYIFALKLLNNRAILKSDNLTNTLHELISESAVYLERLSATLKFISTIFSNEEIPFLIVKTNKGIPYVTQDVDVLVKLSDFAKAEDLLKQAKGKRERDANKHQSSMFLPGLLRIDLHKGFFWQGSSYLDASVPWEDIRYENVSGVRCPIPSVHVELLLTIAHTVGERLHIPYLEFMFVRNSSKEANWTTIINQAEKYSWRKSMFRFISIVNLLNRKLYPSEKKPLIDLQPNVANLLPRVNVHGSLSMPYMYPLQYTMEIFLERKPCMKINDLISNLGYYLFATARYHYSGRLRVPIYNHWFNFDKTADL